MPIYEYECSKCGNTIEVIQKFSDPVLKKHKGCGGALTKLISASGFQFKGTGWYVTDYARKSKRDADSSPEKKDATPNGGTASKESKDSSSTAKGSETGASSRSKKS